MIKILQIIISVTFLLSSINVVATELTKDDVELIHKDINAIYEAFESGDISVFLDNTHSSIYKLVGGKSNFENTSVSAIAGLMEQGVIFHEATLGEPEELYFAGEEEVCFVPRVSIMEIQGQKMKSTGFLIAIRDRGMRSWKYLDGSGLRKDQSLLWKLLPELTKNVKLPANFLELL